MKIALYSKRIDKYLTTNIINHYSGKQTNIVEAIYLDLQKFVTTKEFKDQVHLFMTLEYGKTPFKNVEVFSKEYNSILKREKELNTFTKKGIYQYIIENHSTLLYNPDFILNPYSKILEANTTRNIAILKVAESFAYLYTDFVSDNTIGTSLNLLLGSEGLDFISSFEIDNSLCDVSTVKDIQKEIEFAVEYCYIYPSDIPNILNQIALFISDKTYLDKYKKHLNMIESNLVWV